MGKINFLEIITQAWNITWSHKKLWWLGLIVGSGSWLNFNLPVGSQDKTISFNRMYSFFSENISFLIGVIMFLIFVFLALGILKILAYGGLIRSIYKIESEKDSSFWINLKKGKKFFWRILGVKAIISFFSLILLLFLMVPIIFLFSMESYALGSITSLIALLIFFPTVVILSFTEMFSNFYILTSDLSLRSAIEQGYAIFGKNIGSSLIMAFIFLPLNILIGIAILIAIIISSIPLVILGAILYQTFFSLGTWLIGILGVTLILVFLLAVRSFLGVFSNVAWLLFFQKIATAKKEPIETKEELIIENEIRPEEA